MLERKIISASSLLLVYFLAVPEAHAQFSYRRTVGDESENQYQPGATHALGYRGSIISNPSLDSKNSSLGNFTRHSRLGESTGIGGSTLQTASATSESRPALLRPQSISAGTALLSRPKFDLHFESGSDSPALRNNFKIGFPSSGDAELFGRTPETFTNSSILPSLGTEKYSAPATSDFEF